MLRILVETTDGEESEFEVTPGTDIWSTKNRLLMLKIGRTTFNFPFETLRCFTIEPKNGDSA